MKTRRSNGTAKQDQPKENEPPVADDSKISRVLEKRSFPTPVVVGQKRPMASPLVGERRSKRGKAYLLLPDDVWKQMFGAYLSISDQIRMRRVSHGLNRLVLRHMRSIILSEHDFAKELPVRRPVMTFIDYCEKILKKYGGNLVKLTIKSRFHYDETDPFPTDQLCDLICSHCTNLTYLDCGSLFDKYSTLNRIGWKLEKLTDLVVQGEFPIECIVNFPRLLRLYSNLKEDDYLGKVRECLGNFYCSALRKKLTELEFIEQFEPTSCLTDFMFQSGDYPINGIRKLTFGNDEPTPGDRLMESCRNFMRVHELSLDFIHFSSFNFVRLFPTPLALKSLVICCCQWNPGAKDNLDLLERFSEIESLKLEREIPLLDDEDFDPEWNTTFGEFRFLRAFSKLRKIDVKCPEFTGSSLENLSKSAPLESVILTMYPAEVNGALRCLIDRHNRLKDLSIDCVSEFEAPYLENESLLIDLVRQSTPTLERLLLKTGAVTDNLLISALCTSRLKVELFGMDQLTISRLKYLYLSPNEKVTPGGIGRFVETRSYLLGKYPMLPLLALHVGSSLLLDAEISLLSKVDDARVNIVAAAILESL